MNIIKKCILTKKLTNKAVSDIQNEFLNGTNIFLLIICQNILISSN